MFSTRRILVTVLLLTLVLGGTFHSPVHAQSDSAYLRGANFITGAVKIDIYVDGQPAITNVINLDASSYITLTPGQHKLGFGQAGKGQPIGDSILTEVKSGDLFTFFVVGDAKAGQVNYVVSSESGEFKRQNVEMTAQTIPFLFVQGATDVPAVDLYVNDKQVASAVKSGAWAAFVMPVTGAILKVTPAGDANTKLADVGAVALFNTVGVVGLSGSSAKLSLDASYSTPQTAAQFMDAQKDNQAFSLNSFLKAITAAKLNDTLAGKGPMTVFAVFDKAFAKVVGDSAAQDKLFADPKIADIVKYHIASDTYTFDDILNGVVAGGLTVKTLQGSDLVIGRGDSGFVFGTQAVGFQGYNVHTGNAVVHFIDTLLTPPAK